MRLRVFFVGASGTGKSTMAKLLASELRLEFANITPSEVYRRHGTNVTECWTDPVKMRAVQEGIADYTIEEFERRRESAGYVTDRGFDLGVYGAILGYPHPAHKVERLMTAMHTAPADADRELVTVTVFVRPNPRVLHQARIGDAGRRAQFLTDSWVYRVDGALAYYIRTRQIAVLEIPEMTADMNERMALVRAHLAPYTSHLLPVDCAPRL